MGVDPILIEIPMPIVTPRLLLRPPAPGDGKRMNAAIRESFADLHIWMPWASEMPTVEESEAVVRRAAAQFLLREDLMLLITDRATGDILGGTGLHRFDWSVPRFEIGYWMRSSRQGQGVTTESTNALTRFAFEALGAKRVEIRCDEKNHRSLKVIQKLGFDREALMIGDARTPVGELRNTLVYARIQPDGLPHLDVRWGETP